MTNELASGSSVSFTKGQEIKMYGDAERGCEDKIISTVYDQLTKSVEVGQIILIDEGALKLEVTEVSEDVDYILV